MNGTRNLEAKAAGKEYSPIWLKDGDTIELEIDLLGRLSNKIALTKERYSILEKKKSIEHAT